MKKIFSILSLFVAFAITTVSCSNDDDPISLSTLATITDFTISINDVDADDITYDLGSAITIDVPFGTDISAVTPTMVISDGATITPASGEVISFVDGEAMSFVVTAEDGVTTKEYSVTINIKGEVGSGSQLLTYQIADLFGENSITTYTYNESNFVSSYSVELDDWGTLITAEYTIIYDDKNQVIEKKSTEAKESTVYEYNDAGQIVEALYSNDGTLTYTYAYSYDAAGNLSKEVRTDHTDADATTEVAFTIVDGNVTVETRYGDDYVATYDDKNNPFKGQYPAAYSAIHAAIQLVNTNNPVSGTLADDAITYEYNTDNYPTKSSYTYFDGLATVEKTFTY
ncbi:YD repeat-containing protein [Polaribacter sp. KT25b]|uniref:hypothetical protein n=1 Tax=Polaribacter sp. KT25b TaxID=1855336 RepID=UPI00087AB3AE|nr:hypothetical protein [Polaribacter sp. KT25b]SDS48775.1 YD repeat-containing protein [Polaribacter sp. KT25b]